MEQKNSRLHSNHFKMECRNKDYKWETKECFLTFERNFVILKTGNRIIRYWPKWVIKSLTDSNKKRVEKFLSFDKREVSLCFLVESLPAKTQQEIKNNLKKHLN